MQEENQFSASFSYAETVELKITKLWCFNSLQAVILSECTHVLH